MSSDRTIEDLARELRGHLETAGIAVRDAMQFVDTFNAQAQSLRASAESTLTSLELWQEQRNELASRLNISQNAISDSLVKLGFHPPQEVT